jgi:hypothetical protein
MLRCMFRVLQVLGILLDRIIIIIIIIIIVVVLIFYITSWKNSWKMQWYYIHEQQRKNIDGILIHVNIHIT